MYNEPTYYVKGALVDTARGNLSIEINGKHYMKGTTIYTSLLDIEIDTEKGQLILGVIVSTGVSVYSVLKSKEQYI